MEHFEVIIVGAGFAGISAAYYLKNKCPTKNFCILESRDKVGGTWNLYKYPGVRADSDMHAMAYKFKPWQGSDVASGDEIENYLLETFNENNLNNYLKLNHQIIRADWNSKDKKWTLTCQTKNSIKKISCNFLFACTGFYDYEQAYVPKIQGLGEFNGPVIHPQFWPKDLNYTNKHITVIGSGAAAISLIPELAKKAKQVVMLQRSPTYFAPFNADTKAEKIRKKYPKKIADRLIRWFSIVGVESFVRKCKYAPNDVKQYLLENVSNILGKDFDIEKHFTPKYNPWEQRMCLDRNNELLLAIKNKKVSIVTDTISKFTANKIELSSGEKINTDIVVMATGFSIKILGGIEIYVDNKKVNPGETIMYKGAMFSGLPNLFGTSSYSRHTWTLKFELIHEYACRLINYMDQKKFKSVTPMPTKDIIENQLPYNDLTSSYVLRSLDILPKQGARRPWQSVQNYDIDLLEFKLAKFNDGFLNFEK